MEQDIAEMPPAIVRGFSADNILTGHRSIGHLGSDLGSVKLDDGSIVDGGRVLRRDQWNSALCSPLQEKQQPQENWVHKNRLSVF